MFTFLRSGEIGSYRSAIQKNNNVSAQQPRQEKGSLWAENKLTTMEKKKQMARIQFSPSEKLREGLRVKHFRAEINKCDT